MAERDRFYDNVEDNLISKGNATKRDLATLSKELKEIEK